MPFYILSIIFYIGGNGAGSLDFCKGPIYGDFGAGGGHGGGGASDIRVGGWELTDRIVVGGGGGGHGNRYDVLTYGGAGGASVGGAGQGYLGYPIAFGGSQTMGGVGGKIHMCNYVCNYMYMYASDACNPKYLLICRCECYK